MDFLDRLRGANAVGRIVKLNNRYLSLPLYHRRPPEPFDPKHSQRAAREAMVVEMLGPEGKTWRPRSRGRLDSCSVLRRIAERDAMAACRRRLEGEG